MPSTPDSALARPDPMTLIQHIQASQRAYPFATGDFTSLMAALTVAAKVISREVSHAGLAEILGLTGKRNVQGEEVQKLDEYANETMIRNLERTGALCLMGSEEVSEPIEIPPDYPYGKYVALFDPLDGSSNIDVNVSIGTIFGLYQRLAEDGPGSLEDLLQPGTRLVAAGYVLYGSSTMFVYTAGRGVHGFTLDPLLGEFLLSHPNMKIPERGNIFSINYGNRSHWTEPVIRLVEHWESGGEGRPYTGRYIGSLVADFHRSLLKGGVFLYPADNRDASRSDGKLRLLYEAAPLAFVCEQAGGSASTGTRRILEIEPRSLHQRTPLIIGSPEEVALAESFHRESRPMS